jgi:hypothetical protein
MVGDERLGRGQVGGGEEDKSNKHKAEGAWTKRREGVLAA